MMLPVSEASGEGLDRGTDVTAQEQQTDREASHKARTIVAGVLGTLAVLCLVVASIGVWAKATVLQRDRFTALTEDALAQSEVQAGLATYITNAVFDAVDVDAIVADVLPSQLGRAAPAIAAGVESSVERRLTDLLGTEEVQNLLNGIIGRAHDRAMDVLQGDGLADGINVSDGGEVSVNLLPLVGRGLSAVQSLGLLSDVELPTLTRDGDPAQQVAELETALGRDLPDDLGQLVVYQSDSVASAHQSVQQAQRVLVLVQRGVVLLVIAAILLVAATVLVAPRRWRATFALGLGTAAALVVLRSVVRQVVEDAPGLAVKPGAKAAIEAILGGAAASLLRLTGILLLLAIAAVVVALWREGWRRNDIALAAGFGVGMLVLVILDTNLVSLVLAIAATVAAVFAARALLPRFGGGPVSPPPAPAAAGGVAHEAAVD